MTSWQAQGKLLGMAKQKSLLPWSEISRVDDDIICFEGCMFFFYETYVMIWCMGIETVETLQYSKAMETDFIRWVDMIAKMNGVESWN